MFYSRYENTIAEAESRFSYVCDPRTKWELVKCEIRSFAINYSIKRSEQREDKERELEKELFVLEE